MVKPRAAPKKPDRSASASAEPPSDAGSPRTPSPDIKPLGRSIPEPRGHLGAREADFLKRRGRTSGR